MQNDKYPDTQIAKDIRRINMMVNEGRALERLGYEKESSQIVKQLLGEYVFNPKADEQHE